MLYKFYTSLLAFLLCTTWLHAETSVQRSILRNSGIQEHTSSYKQFILFALERLSQSQSDQLFTKTLLDEWNQAEDNGLLRKLFFERFSSEQSQTIAAWYEKPSIESFNQLEKQVWSGEITIKTRTPEEYQTDSKNLSKERARLARLRVEDFLDVKPDIKIFRYIGTNHHTYAAFLEDKIRIIWYIKQHIMQLNYNFYDTWGFTDEQTSMMLTFLQSEEGHFLIKNANIVLNDFVAQVYMNAIESFVQQRTQFTEEEQSLSEAEKAQQEKQFFEEVKSENTREGFASYRKKYPNGKFLEDVDKLEEDYFYHLAKMEDRYALYLGRYAKGRYVDEIKELREAYNYKKLRSSNSLSSYEVFLNRYPNSKYTDEVKGLIETYHYEMAKKHGEVFANEYLRKYPQGRYVEEVKQMLKKP